MMIPYRYAGDEEIENRRNVTDRHCKIGTVTRRYKPIPSLDEMIRSHVLPIGDWFEQVRV